MSEKKIEVLLSEMVQIPTVQSVPEKYKIAEYRDYLRREFPNVFAVMEETSIGEALLLKWEGKNPELLPVLLSGHMDVVDATDEGWEQPAFSGAIVDGMIWGRGSLDMKGAQCAFLVALEEKCARGETPERTIYTYLSCDEEVGGPTTKKAADYLKEQGVKLEAVFDEGGTLTQDWLGRVPGRSAVLGIAEKGSVIYEVTAAGHGGHSANPQPGSAIVRLASFICDVENNCPFIRQLSDGEKACLRAAAKYMDEENAAKFIAAADEVDDAHPILHEIVGDANARLGATAAFTMIRGGTAENVMPASATVTINVRVPSFQPADSVTAIFEKLAEKYDLTVERKGGRDASTVTDVEGWAYKYTEKIINKVFPGMPVMPFMLGGGTDSRWFMEVAKDAIRFSPIYIDRSQGAGVHGMNERMSVESLYESVEYYREFLKEL